MRSAQIFSGSLRFSSLVDVISLIFITSRSLKARSISSIPFINEKTRPEFNYYLSQNSQLIDTGPYPTHEVLRHYNFISQVSGKFFNPKIPKIEWIKKSSSIIENKTLGRRYVVLNPGSNEYGRRWPLRFYIDVANKFINNDYAVVFVGGKGELVDGLKTSLEPDSPIINSGFLANKNFS